MPEYSWNIESDFDWGYYSAYIIQGNTQYEGRIERGNNVSDTLLQGAEVSFEIVFPAMNRNKDFSIYFKDWSDDTYQFNIVVN